MATGQLNGATATPASLLSVHVDCDDELTRSGIDGILTRAPGIDLAASNDADVIVVVVARVGDEELRRLRSLRRRDDQRTVVLVDKIDENGMLAAIEAGVSGILLRAQAVPDALVASLRTAAAGDGSLAPELLGQLFSALGRFSDEVLGPRGLSAAMLSDREIAVLKLASEGYGTAEIAQMLCYSPRTIKNVVSDVIRRFNLRNRTHAVAFAIRTGRI